MTPWSEDRLLALLRETGAGALERIRFRPNRRTLWSITGGGRRLNLHEAYREAPWDVVVHFATLVRGVGRPGGRRTPAFRRSAGAVRGWSGLERTRRQRRLSTPGPCCATAAQRRWLTALYRHVAATRFTADLPTEIPVRLSRRMTSRLGHMRGGTEDRGPRWRRVVEIALSLDLMLPGNEEALVDTLVHEVAHAADWLASGGRGHGPGWKALARRAGCSTRARCAYPIRRRLRPDDPVEHVPGEAPEALAARLRPVQP
ncbi:MAG: SprT-like domain-containing protein [Gemmatimonadota bacterium]